MLNPIEITVEVVNEINIFELLLNALFTLIATGIGAGIAFYFNKKQSKEEFKRMINYENYRKLDTMLNSAEEELNNYITEMRSLNTEIFNESAESIDKFRMLEEKIMNVALRVCSPLFYEEDLQEDAMIFSRHVNESAELVSVFIRQPSQETYYKIDHALWNSKLVLVELKEKIVRKMKILD